MKASIDENGIIHIEAVTNAETFALKWHSARFSENISHGVIFHEQELTRETVSSTEIME